MTYTVISIGSEAFYNYDRLTSSSIYCHSETPPEARLKTFGNNSLSNNTLYVPNGYKADYETVDPWRNFWNIEEMNFSGVDDIMVDSDVKVSVKGKIIFIEDKDDNCIVEVYTVNGQLNYHGNDTTIPITTNGTYIVYVIGKFLTVVYYETV